MVDAILLSLLLVEGTLRLKLLRQRCQDLLQQDESNRSRLKYCRKQNNVSLDDDERTTV